MDGLTVSINPRVHRLHGGWRVCRKFGEAEGAFQSLLDAYKDKNYVITM
jgi:hypothetical protein